MNKSTTEFTILLSEALLAAIYAVATEPGAFQQASQHLADELGYQYGLISLWQDRQPLDLSLNQPQIVMAAYSEHYFKLDPWTGYASRTLLGELIQIPDNPRLYDTEFYVDFARPMGVIDAIGVRMPLAPGSEMILGMNQRLHAHRPTEADGLAVQEVGRHLQRALQLRRRFESLAGARNDLLGALNRVEFGMAITSADGRVHALNQAAESAIAAGCGLRVQKGILTAINGSDALPLTLLISDASNGGAGGALRLRVDERRWLSLLVAPLPPQARWPQQGSRTLVAFRLPEVPSTLDARVLMSSFGLSRVEAQVAIGMMDGLSMEEIALRRGVKPSTVKSQLDSIFEKTETSSQRGLVRLLGSLPPVRVVGG